MEDKKLLRAAVMPMAPAPEPNQWLHDPGLNNP